MCYRFEFVYVMFNEVVLCVWGGLQEGDAGDGGTGQCWENRHSTGHPGR